MSYSKLNEQNKNARKCWQLSTRFSRYIKWSIIWKDNQPTYSRGFNAYTDFPNKPIRQFLPLRLFKVRKETNQCHVWYKYSNTTWPINRWKENNREQRVRRFMILAIRMFIFLPVNLFLLFVTGLKLEILIKAVENSAMTLIFSNKTYWKIYQDRRVWNPSGDIPDCIRHWDHYCTAVLNDVIVRWLVTIGEGKFFSRFHSKNFPLLKCLQILINIDCWRIFSTLFFDLSLLGCSWTRTHCGSNMWHMWHACKYIDCYEGLWRVIHIQNNKIYLSIKENSFVKNWKLFKL